MSLDIPQWIFVLVSGVAIPSGVAFVLKQWISVRLKQSIEAEYLTALEELKKELQKELQQVAHELEVDRMRTSMFFDHQRSAFAEIISHMASTNLFWAKAGHEPHAGLIRPVNPTYVERLRKLYFDHRLFIDEDCAMAVELMLDVYQESFPFEGENGEVQARDVERPYAEAQYLLPRIAQLFQLKIGVASDRRPLRQIALLGAVRTLNNLHLRDAGGTLPDSLRYRKRDEVMEVVYRTEQSIDVLRARLETLRDYLSSNEHRFPDHLVRVSRYIAAVES